MDPVRLACVKHAASVRPEPGSNSPTKACRRPQRLPGADERLVVERGVEWNARVTAIMTLYYLLPSTGSVGGRIDRQLDLTAPPRSDRPDELPALAFCLLFRFQGAEALAHRGGRNRPAWLGAGALPEAASLPWAKRNTSRAGSPAHPWLTKTLRPGGGTSCPAAGAGSGRAAASGRRARARRRSSPRWRGNRSPPGCVGHRPSTGRDPP